MTVLGKKRGERERQRHRERDRDTQRDRESERETERERERITSLKRSSGLTNEARAIAGESLPLM